MAPVPWNILTSHQPCPWGKLSFLYLWNAPVKFYVCHSKSIVWFAILGVILNLLEKMLIKPCLHFLSCNPSPLSLITLRLKFVSQTDWGTVKWSKWLCSLSMPNPDPIPSYPSGQSFKVWPGESYSGVTEGSSVLAQGEHACVQMSSLWPGLVSSLSWGARLCKGPPWSPKTNTE